MASVISLLDLTVNDSASVVELTIYGSAVVLILLTGKAILSAKMDWRGRRSSEPTVQTAESSEKHSSSNKELSVANNSSEGELIDTTNADETASSAQSQDEPKQWLPTQRSESSTILEQAGTSSQVGSKEPHSIQTEYETRKADQNPPSLPKRQGLSDDSVDRRLTARQLLRHVVDPVDVNTGVGPFTSDYDLNIVEFGLDAHLASADMGYELIYLDALPSPVSADLTDSPVEASSTTIIRHFLRRAVENSNPKDDYSQQTKRGSSDVDRWSQKQPQQDRTARTPSEPNIIFPSERRTGPMEERANAGNQDNVSSRIPSTEPISGPIFEERYEFKDQTSEGYLTNTASEQSISKNPISFPGEAQPPQALTPSMDHLEKEPVGLDRGKNIARIDPDPDELNDSKITQPWPKMEDSGLDTASPGFSPGINNDRSQSDVGLDLLGFQERRDDLFTGIRRGESNAEAIAGTIAPCEVNRLSEEKPIEVGFCFPEFDEQANNKFCSSLSERTPSDRETEFMMQNPDVSLVEWPDDETWI